MKNTEFSQCLECGTIDYDSDIPRVGDPSASDGSLTECPHCGAIDESVSIHIVMHQVYPESTGYLAAFYAETLGQRTPLVRNLIDLGKGLEMTPSQILAEAGL
jgi:hypothetical protein